MNLLSKLNELKEQGKAPEWMTEESYKTLSGGYLQVGETPFDMYTRVANSAASYCKEPKVWEKKFFDAMWSNWLCIASPIASNMGTTRGLPISCNTIHVGDSVNSIFNKNTELATLSKNGAGVGIYIGDIRARGVPIKGNGFSEGIVPWAKVYDITTSSINQGSTRRGASALYLPIRHGDVEEFMNIRRPTGDVNRRCLNTNHGVCIDDAWMQEMLAGDTNKRNIWENLLLSRYETGEPYIFFSDHVNNQSPECYKANNLTVKSSNICCLSGDTLVLTDSGPERIDELVGKTVNIWDGVKWVANSSFEQRGNDELIRLHLKDGSYVDSNANHRWFAAYTYDNIRRNKYKETLTKNLSVGVWLESHSQEQHGDIQEKGAYLKGFLVGDGTHVQDRPMLNLHFPKFNCENKLINSANELAVESINTNSISAVEFSDIKNNTGSMGSWGLQVFKSMKGLSVRKSELIDWATTYKNMLPKSVFNWSKETKLDFLAGLLDADGTVHSSSSIQISSIYKQFIVDLQLLLKTFGFSSGIDCCVKENGADSFRLSISAYDSFTLFALAPFQRLRAQTKPNRKTTGWRQIVKIEKLSGVHPVYCPILPSTGKFGLANGLMTGNTEITLFTDEQHSFVCCLSSLNLNRWDEWKDSDVVETSIRFLDCVLEEYIKKASDIPFMECSVRSAIKGRAIGLGVLGWHSLLQSKMVAFDSFDAMMLNSTIFRTMRQRADTATRQLAIELGEPEWCKGFGIRNTHLLAIAPTVSNSTISGGLSAGVEPIAANVYNAKSAKGNFIRKNTLLEALLESKGKNTPDVWKSINEESGSVQHLKFLSPHEKSVFLTAREINQHAVIKQAAQRQQWIDQAQSINLFFAANSSAKYIHEVHVAAWEQKLKTLYYLRTEGVIKGDLASRSKEECEACSG